MQTRRPKSTQEKLRSTMQAIHALKIDLNAYAEQKVVRDILELADWLGKDIVIDEAENESSDEKVSDASQIKKKRNLATLKKIHQLLNDASIECDDILELENIRDEQLSSTFAPAARAIADLKQSVRDLEGINKEDVESIFDIIQLHAARERYSLDQTDMTTYLNGQLAALKVANDDLKQLTTFIKAKEALSRADALIQLKADLAQQLIKQLNSDIADYQRTLADYKNNYNSVKAILASIEDLKQFVDDRMEDPTISHSSNVECIHKLTKLRATLWQVIDLINKDKQAKIADKDKQTKIADKDEQAKIADLDSQLKAIKASLIAESHRAHGRPNLEVAILDLLSELDEGKYIDHINRGIIPPATKLFEKAQQTLKRTDVQTYYEDLSRLKALLIKARDIKISASITRVPLTESQQTQLTEISNAVKEGLAIVQLREEIRTYRDYLLNYDVRSVNVDPHANISHKIDSVVGVAIALSKQKSSPSKMLVELTHVRDVLRETHATVERVVLYSRKPVNPKRTYFSDELKNHAIKQYLKNTQEERSLPGELWRKMHYAIASLGRALSSFGKGCLADMGLFPHEKKKDPASRIELSQKIHNLADTLDHVPTFSMPGKR